MRLILILLPLLVLPLVALAVRIQEGIKNHQYQNYHQYQHGPTRLTNLPNISSSSSSFAPSILAFVPSSCGTHHQRQETKKLRFGMVAKTHHQQHHFSYPSGSIPKVLPTIIPNTNHGIYITTVRRLGTTPLFQNSPKHNEAEQSPQEKEMTLENENDDKNKIFLDTIRTSVCSEIVPKVLSHFHRRRESVDNAPLTHPHPPLVIVLAVSGGSDSVALFHSIVGMLSPASQSLQKDGALKEKCENSDHNGAGDVAALFHLRCGKHCNPNATGERNVGETSDNVIPCHIHVAHFNHRQRGEESDEDASFVRELCDSVNRQILLEDGLTAAAGGSSGGGIPFHCFDWSDDDDENDINERNTQTKKFSQEIARNWRRRTLTKLLDSLTGKHCEQPGVVFTAHHRDDSEETMLLKLLRGVHITNLSGMDVVTMQDDGGGTIDVFAKPMLSVRKVDIERYLHSQDLAWRVDESNASNKYLRNRVRNELVPLLKDIVGGGDILQNRLDNLEKQSQKMKNDLSARAEMDKVNYERDGDSFQNLVEKENSLPSWVKGLFYYRPVESKPSLSSLPRVTMAPLSLEEKTKKSSNADGDSTDSENDLQEKQNKINFPLASLVNVEALLLASGQEVFDKESDKSFFSSNNLDSTSIKTIQPISSSETALNELSSSEGELLASKSNPLEVFPSAAELGDWDKLIQTLQQNVKDLVDSSSVNPAFDLSLSTELILKEATMRIESFINEASDALSPEKVQNLIAQASLTLDVNENADVFKTTIDGIVAAAEALAIDQGLDVSDAVAQARSTAKYTAEFLQAANGVLVSGYVKGDSDRDGTNQDFAREMSIELEIDTVSSKPLFHRFQSARSIPNDEFKQTIAKGSEMATVSGAIYQNTIPVMHSLDYSIVANGTTSDVAWMVSDSIGYESEFKVVNESGSDKIESPILVRTVTIRGFDASDDSVDRERLLNNICTAKPVSLGKDKNGLKVHKGLLDIAKELYSKLVPFIDSASPRHKVVLNGHSIGGSLSVLLLLLLAENRGSDFVREKVLRVFTYGAPPVTNIDNAGAQSTMENTNKGIYHCPVLSAFDLPASTIYGYAQPWDPIIRLFSSIDALYPLIGDLGEDGVTLYSSGPTRALRPITRAILESWEGWPYVRDSFKGTAQQNYTSVGIQHLLLPDPTRYLTDRLVSVNVAAHPVDKVLRISSSDLLPALEETFPLDVFSISFVPAALRSFIHHFYPAYGIPFVEYAEREKTGGGKKDSSAQKLPNNSDGENVKSKIPSPVNGINLAP